MSFIRFVVRRLGFNGGSFLWATGHFSTHVSHHPHFLFLFLFLVMFVFVFGYVLYTLLKFVVSFKTVVLIPMITLGPLACWSRLAQTLVSYCLWSYSMKAYCFRPFACSEFIYLLNFNKVVQNFRSTTFYIHQQVLQHCFYLLIQLYCELYQ